MRYFFCSLPLLLLSTFTFAKSFPLNNVDVSKYPNPSNELNIICKVYLAYAADIQMSQIAGREMHEGLKAVLAVAQMTHVPDKVVLAPYNDANKAQLFYMTQENKIALKKYGVSSMEELSNPAAFDLIKNTEYKTIKWSREVARAKGCDMNL